MPKSRINRFLNQPIGYGECHPGEVGIEIEAEGSRLPTSLQYYWTTHNDGSLRILKSGDQAVEYVLRKPIVREEVGKALSYLDTKFQEHKSKIYDSYRTSIHVHINMQSETYLTLFNLITLWYIFENPLVAWCGKEREANLFCLRAVDAEEIIDCIRHVIETGDIAILGDNHVRYAAMNLAALSKFGSVEFRSLSGAPVWERVNQWVSVLLKIKDASHKFENPKDIIRQFSTHGPNGLAKRVLGDTNYSRFGFGKWEEPWQSMRFAQEIAFASDWKPEKMEKITTKRPRKTGDYLAWQTLGDGQVHTGPGQMNIYTNAVPPAPPPMEQWQLINTNGLLSYQIAPGHVFNQETVTNLVALGFSVHHFRHNPDNGTNAVYPYAYLPPPAVDIVLPEPEPEFIDHDEEHAFD